MMTMHATQHGIPADVKKAMRSFALAFFLFTLAVPTTHAASNVVDGTAYGTNYSDLAIATAISSEADGPGSLTISWAGTTEITLSNNVNGSIDINNAFDTFGISATDSSVSNGLGSAVLTVTGGDEPLYYGRKLCRPERNKHRLAQQWPTNTRCLNRHHICLKCGSRWLHQRYGNRHHFRHTLSRSHLFSIQQRSKRNRGLDGHQHNPLFQHQLRHTCRR